MLIGRIAKYLVTECVASYSCRHVWIITGDFVPAYSDNKNKYYATC